MTRCFVLSDLFPGKMHALVYRRWKQRVKGRDWYDFEWYVKNGVKLNFNHLQERIKQFDNIEISKSYSLLLLATKNEGDQYSDIEFYIFLNNKEYFSKEV